MRSMGERLAIDFESDWVTLLRDALRRAGYAVSDAESADMVGMMYFNARRRWIPRRARAVLFSRTFSCPAEHRAGVDLIVSKCQAAEDLNSHQSRSLFDSASYNDGLLNDWGMHHLHLGLSTEPSGLAARTDFLLLARVTEDTFYGIDVRPHGAWHDRDLVQIVHDNWPDSIRQYRLDGYGSPEAHVTSEEVRVLRRGHITVTLQMSDGTIYYPPGGGYGSDGTSFEAVRTSDYYLRRVRELEQYVKDHVQELCVAVLVERRLVARPWVVRLRLDADGTAYAVEVNSKVAFPLGAL